MYKILLTIFIAVRSLNVSQALLQFEDENYYGFEADMIDWSEHPCNRPCSDQSKPKNCYYRFIVETFLTLSKACYNCPRNVTDCFRPHCIPGDGFNKVIYTVNRQLPGPYIQACLGDNIIVDVKNAMQSASTTIHWHGLRQIDTPYMDGVPFVTQCPILPQSVFRYQFKADQIGTYFWHSHIGGQRVDGFFGALTIRAPSKLNPHKDLYDFDEHSMVINNWHTKRSLDDVYTRYTQGGIFPNTESILVNGLGRFKNFAKSNEEPIFIPSPVFTVQQGYRYRFRLVNAGTDSSIQVSIDNHSMLIISTDGHDIEPVEVDSFTVWPGERYDFVLHADQQIDNYWFRYRLRRGASNDVSKYYQVAVLRYETAEWQDPDAPIDWDIIKSKQTLRILNPYLPYKAPKSQKIIKMTSLKALESDDELIGEYVVHQFYLDFNRSPIDEYEFHRSKLYGFNQVAAVNLSEPIPTFQFNHISFTNPPIPLLPQRKMTTPDMFCNSTTLSNRDCKRVECTCTHTLQVKLKSVVELIIIDKYNVTNNHPIHLHGYSFRVLASGKLQGGVTVDRIKQLDWDGKIKRTLDRAPIKDTIVVPSGGYTIIRFYADNPGYWFFHCHFNPHIELGMALLFKVGEYEEMLPVPKDFPQCGDYVPHIVASYED